MMAVPDARRSSTTWNRPSTSSGSRTAEGSPITITRASCDRARATETICCPAAGNRDDLLARGGQAAALACGPDLRVPKPGEQLPGPLVHVGVARDAAAGQL